MLSDSIPIIASISSSSVRATTPILGYPRKATPQKSTSAPRSNSASKFKDLSIAARHAQDLSPNHRHKRSSSNRRRKQFENDSLIGVNVYMTAGFDMDDKDYQYNLLNPTLAADTRSTIGKLFDNRDYETLELFRQCQDIPTLHKHTKRRFKLPSHLQGYVEAHEAFMCIEKNLRKILYQAIKRENHLLDFIHDFENILLHFAESSDVPTNMTVYPSFLMQLASPLAFDMDTKVIYVDLKDSRLARLMVQAVVKFYRCSYVNHDADAPRSSVFRIRLPMKGSKLLLGKISLTSYFIASMNCEQHMTVSVVNCENQVSKGNAACSESFVFV